MKKYNTFIDTSLNLNCSNKPYNALLDDSKQYEDRCNLYGLVGSNKSPKTEEDDGLVEELNRASLENERLTEMLAVVCQNVNVLRNQIKEHTTKNNRTANDQIMDSNGARKRKPYQYNYRTSNSSDSSSSCCEKYYLCKKAKEELIKPKIYRVRVPIETSDDTSLMVKDGYQWRKYGQKVTRDNPWPRAYFKCSFAPTCLVKKKVQRSIEDQSVVVATYEGEHNHPLPSHLEKQSASTSVTQESSSLPTFATSTHNSSGETITLHLTKQKSEDNEVKDSNATKNVNSDSLQQFLVDQMASSVTRDPSFRAAIAKAISETLLQPN